MKAELTDKEKINTFDSLMKTLRSTLKQRSDKKFHQRIDELDDFTLFSHIDEEFIIDISEVIREKEKFI
jgi:hypothetical protein